MEKVKQSGFCNQIQSDFKTGKWYEHEISKDKVSMTYSWHNISDQYRNNKIKYSQDNGQSWELMF